MDKISLYDYIISDENIYLSIYSAKSYILNKSLLGKKDKELLNSLNDPFNENIICETTKSVKEIVKKILDDKDYLFKTQVYFKPKKYEDKPLYRPVHSAELLQLIAMVTVLNPLIYDYSKKDKLTLSNYSRLIPHNFYGNCISEKPEELYKKWNIQYREYTQKSTEYFNTYYKSGEYKYELKLDLENFFPSINPLIIYQMLLEHKSVTLSDEDVRVLKIIVYKLLVNKVTNLNSLEAKKLYYDNNLQYNCITIGIAQGLPQSFFFGNICMIQIANIIEKVFQGKAIYYVDDSYVYTNCNLSTEELFKHKLEEINEEIRGFSKKYILSAKEDNFLKKEKLKYYNKIMSKKYDTMYEIKIHMDGKSSYTDIQNCANGEIYLRNISREASNMGHDIYAMYSEDEEKSVLSRGEALLYAINNEIKKNDKEKNKDSTQKSYIEKLNRYYKFFKNRVMRLRIKTKKEIDSEIFNVLLKTVEKNSDLESTENDYKIVSDANINIKNFFDCYSNDVWDVAVSILIKYTTKKEDLIQIKKYLLNIIQEIYGEDLYCCSYIKYWYNDFLSDNEMENISDPYETLKRLVNQKMIRYFDLDTELRNNEFKGIRLNGIEDNIMESFDILPKQFLIRCNIVAKSSNRLKRMMLNAIYSKIFKVDISDDISIHSYNKKEIRYGELRALVYLRNNLCDADQFLKWDMSVKSNENISKIDYTIFEVLEIYKRYVVEPKYIDNLILVHKYTCDVWKNGAKHLYFYTLHNQEHAISLIKNILKILKILSYIEIKQYDYYILFIACYLHDISMVKIASDNMFLLDNYKSDLIVTRFEEVYQNESEYNIKNILIDAYRRIDEFFENKIRGNHGKDSAYEIRKREELSFLEPDIRETIAEIAKSHTVDAKDIYFLKGDANQKLISYKFDKILLRLADLLDMCENRVSKLILNHNINNMSDISAFHWISHLLTSEVNLVSIYKENQNYGDTVSFLLPECIIENILVTIKVRMSQMSNENCMKCKYCKIIENTLSENGFEIEMLSEKDSNCTSEKCNFLCRWFNKKNEYFMAEMRELEAYLNRVPKENRFYKTKILIRVVILDDANITLEQFEVLKKVALSD